MRAMAVRLIFFKLASISVDFSAKTLLCKNLVDETKFLDAPGIKSKPRVSNSKARFSQVLRRRIAATMARTKARAARKDCLRSIRRARALELFSQPDASQARRRSKWDW